MNVKNILCPVDFSESGDAAVSYATSLAKEYKAELHLVHVYEQPFAYIDGGFASAPVPAVPPADLEAEEAKLDAIKPEKDVKFRRQFIVGSPADELVDYAKEQNIDMVVMGTHGRTGLKRALMGSVAEQVVRKAACPVLALKADSSVLQPG